MKSLFAKKLVCSHCKGYFKRKNYRQRHVYICTQSDLKRCVRIPIEQSFIIDLIIRRKGEISDEEMVNVLDYVLVRDKWDLEVYFKEDDIPMIIRGNHNYY